MRKSFTQGGYTTKSRKEDTEFHKEKHSHRNDGRTLRFTLAANINLTPNTSPKERGARTDNWQIENYGRF